TLIGLPVTDVDVATTATPEAVIAAVAKAGMKSVPTGVEHGTLTVIANHIPYEVTTLREDVETFGRLAKVRFGTDWLKDASRRDFTINAIYCGAEGSIFDPLGGAADAVARRIRFIGSARDRIAEDYLRILRFFRFYAQYGDGPLDPAELAECTAARDGLAQLSPERIATEMGKLLLAPGAEKAIWAMMGHGLLMPTLGAVPAPRRLARMIELERRFQIRPFRARRLAALCVQSEEDALRLADRLRLSNRERDELAACAGAARLPALGADDRTARRHLYNLGVDAWQEAVLHAWSGDGWEENAGHWQRLLDLPVRAPVPDFPLQGRDIMVFGVPPGERIGQLLADAERHWVEQDFALDRNALLHFVKSRIEGHSAR
ncbi:MAG: CCA tRNA nucleotidyltransferase, partial [Hyphomicrobiaceae bacterium]